MNAKKLFLIMIALTLALGLVVKPAQASSCSQYYTVQRGDYLSKIALKFGVSWRWLAALNNISNPNRIYTGQVLCVAAVDGDKPVDDKPLACTSYHTVKRGQYLSMIARQYGVSWRWLADLNNLANPNRLYVGQVLCVATGGGQGQPGHDPDWYAGFPTISIVGAQEDETVTIAARNLPPDDRFIVTMGKIGTRGQNGIVVGFIDTGQGGDKQVTFEIPAELWGRYQISIRIQSPTSGMYAYDWFYNDVN